MTSDSRCSLITLQSASGAEPARGCDQAIRLICRPKLTPRFEPLRFSRPRRDTILRAPRIQLMKIANHHRSQRAARITLVGASRPAMSGCLVEIETDAAS